MHDFIVCPSHSTLPTTTKVRTHIHMQVPARMPGADCQDARFLNARCEAHTGCMRAEFW